MGDEIMIASTRKEGIVEDARLPSGQHLFADIQNVNPNFLSSKYQLADAMVTLIIDSQLTMLSYHCHPLASAGEIAGMTCAAILLDGHMSLHTWPADGVIALDLFTSNNNNDLIPMLPLMEQLFAIPTIKTMMNPDHHSSAEKPKLHWVHKLRGFRTGFSNYQCDKHPYDQELGEDILCRRDFDLKRPLVSTKTKYQHVDIYELLHPKGTTYAAAGVKSSFAQDDDRSTLIGDGSNKHCTIAPDRALFIDGVLQSSLYGEAAYHEALVHPALLSHPDPRRVAIIGGGEGATLREVLKHSTVEEAVMIEIDGELTNISRTFLPEWSDCSDIVGSEVTSCFDDPRATIYFEDAFGFFLDNFGVDDDGMNMTDTAPDTVTADDDGEDDEELFDIIIMDALDPDDFGDFVDKLYNDTGFIRSLYNGLTESGVFVVQVGAIPQYEDPPDEMSVFYNRAHILNKLEEVGFQNMMVYDEGHCHFYTPWQFLVAFKNNNLISNWHRTSAEIDIGLHQRLRRTKSGKPILRYFDGSTMRNYQIPPKVVQTNQLRNQVSLGLHPELVNSSVSRYIDQKSVEQYLLEDSWMHLPIEFARADS